MSSRPQDDSLIEISDLGLARDELCVSAVDAGNSCDALEQGRILLVRDPTFFKPYTGWEVLRRLPEGALKGKNVAYDSRTGKLSGIRAGTDHEPIRVGMREYCAAATRLCEALLTPYAKRWRIDLTSFRPLEEKSRELPHRERNDLLHIDSFPSRPTNGARILRCFTNINPVHARVWITSEAINTLPVQLFSSAGLNDVAAKAKSTKSWYKRVFAPFARLGRTSFPQRSPYDRFMLSLHDHMKSNPPCYPKAQIHRHEFAPGATWLLFTDGIPHAVIEGQFALEQTFIVPRSALVRPEHAPVAFLERLAGTRLTV